MSVGATQPQPNDKADGDEAEYAQSGKRLLQHCRTWQRGEYRIADVVSVGER